MRKPIATLTALAVCLALATGCDDPRDPNDNVHARNCVDSGGVVKDHHGWGGKWNVYTFWCAKSDGQITDIWFE